MQFKAEVTFGTVLSTLAMLGAGTAAWSDTQSSIKSHDTEIRILKEVDRELKAAALADKQDIIKRLDEIRADVREIRNQQRK